MDSISYGRQYIDNKDISSVTQSLKKEKLTTGDQVDKFEKKIKKYLKCKYALTCNSGTSALFIAYQALGTNKKSNIIMPAINFVASYRVAKFFSSKIYLSDVDPVTGQMTPKNLVECIKKFNLKKIDIVNTMYLGGNPFYIKEFFKLKKKYNFLILEDSCHAFGARYYFKNKFFQVGSCKHADISTFSFHPLKTITTGEGGLITMNKVNYYKTAKLVRSHGIARDNDEYWKNKIEIEGMNFRLSDINAALGISQLKKINFFLKKRKELSNKYNFQLKKYHKFIFGLSNEDNNFYSSNHLKILHFNFKNLMCNKDDIFNFFLKKKIYLQFHYQSIKNYKIFNSKSVKLNGANKYIKTAISFPIHVNINDKELNYIFKSIEQLIKKYQKNEKK